MAEHREKTEKREMTCICCPLGCALTAIREENGEITVTGNTCPRGAAYAKNEWTDPRRTVTTTVRVRRNSDIIGTEAADRAGDLDCAEFGMVSVKTADAIPKDKIMDCIKALAEVELEAPVHIGDIVLANVSETGIDVVATKNYL